MHAHLASLLDRLPRSDSFRADCIRAMCFDLGSYDDLHDLATTAPRELIALPAPLSLFAVHDATFETFTLAKQIGDEVHCTVALRDGSGQGAVLDAVIVATVPDAPLQVRRSDGSIVTSADVNELLAKAMILVSKIVFACEVFGCSNVDLLPNAPSAFSQQRRKEAGKAPLFTWHTLHIRNAHAVRKGSGEGSHASPRLHFRRGHIRRLPDRKVWVHSCMVGDASKGYAHKDYKVDKFP